MKLFALTALTAAIGVSVASSAFAAPLSPASKLDGGRAFEMPLETVAANEDRMTAKLEARGYSNIKFKSAPGPFNAAEACLGADLLALKVSRWGDIVNRKRIGQCPGASAGGVDQATFPIAALLESRGFSRLEFTDKTPPSLTIEACRDGRRLRLVVNKFGDIKDRKRIGECDISDEKDEGASGNTAKKLPGLFNTRQSREQISAVLTAQGFTDVKFTGRFFFRYKVEACRGGEIYKLVLNRFGEIRKSTPAGLGQCTVAERDFVGRRKPKEYSKAVIRAKGRIDPELCQEYFDWLLYENTVLFDVGSAKIRPDSAALLQDLGYVASRCPEASIEISGHTDSDGSDDYNQELSEKRAQSVAQFLVKRKVSRDRLASIGYGEERPVLPNTTAENKQFNRRIEFIVRWE